MKHSHNAEHNYYTVTASNGESVIVSAEWAGGIKFYAAESDLFRARLKWGKRRVQNYKRVCPGKTQAMAQVAKYKALLGEE